MDDGKLEAMALALAELGFNDSEKSSFDGVLKNHHVADERERETRERRVPQRAAPISCKSNSKEEKKRKKITTNKDFPYHLPFPCSS